MLNCHCIKESVFCLNFWEKPNLVKNVLFPLLLAFHISLKNQGVELKNQGPLGGKKFVIQKSLHLTKHCSNYQNRFLTKRVLSLVCYIMYCLSSSLRSVQDTVCARVGWSILGDDLNSRD